MNKNSVVDTDTRAMNSLTLKKGITMNYTYYFSTVTSCCPALHIKWLNQLYRVCVAPAVLYAESILPFICIALIANLGHSSYVVSNAVCRQFPPTMLPSMTIPHDLQDLPSPSHLS